jgi:hypothetical protein
MLTFSIKNHKNHVIKKLYRRERQANSQSNIYLCIYLVRDLCVRIVKKSKKKSKHTAEILSGKTKQ